MSCGISFEKSICRSILGCATCVIYNPFKAIYNNYLKLWFRVDKKSYQEDVMHIYDGSSLGSHVDNFQLMKTAKTFSMGSYKWEAISAHVCV